MIENSEKNLEWFRNRYHVPPNRYKLFKSHAAEISLLLAQLPGVNVSAIVTEGTLGPIYGTLPKKPEMASNFKNLAKLYDQVFREFGKFLDPAARIVMCLPAYKTSHSAYEYMPNLDFATQNGYTVQVPIPEEYRLKYKFLKVTERGTMVYDRKDQVVAREIVVFSKYTEPAPVPVEAAAEPQEQTEEVPQEVTETA
jgi:tRNA G10  N-methylase Trm11